MSAPLTVYTTTFCGPCRRLKSQLGEASIEYDEINIEFSRMQLEQATWAETNRIEQVATQRIGMVFPQAAELVVIKP